MPTSFEGEPALSSDDAIVFSDVTKSYRLGAFGGDLRNDVRAFFERLRGRQAPGESKVQRVEALEDVSLRIRRGENIGIIGPNGAGKSTLLKLVARITRPNRGEIWVRGRVAALIQLGAGFHKELTGRENVFLYGTIMGLSYDELAARYDDIVAFAELGPFMDTPVKRYSDGMYIRLGFSVAVHVDADILLIDEVLAVGDHAFREKCLRRMRAYMDGDTTMLFVSHDRELVAGVCDRAILLDGGRVQADGPVREVLDTYEARVFSAGRVRLDDRPRQQKPPPVALTEVSIRDADGRIATDFAEGERLRLRIGWVAHEDVAALAFGARIQAGMTLVYETRSADTAEHWTVRAGQSGWAELNLERLPLLGGQYTVSAWVETGALGFTGRRDSLERGLHFQVRAGAERGSGLVSLGPTWRLDLEGAA